MNRRHLVSHFVSDDDSCEPLVYWRKEICRLGLPLPLAVERLDEVKDTKDEEGTGTADSNLKMLALMISGVE